MAIQAKVLQGAERLLAVFCEIEKATSSGEVPMQHLRILCALALQGEVPMADLEKVTGTTQAAVSRSIARLGKGQNPKEPGFGLLEAYEDPWYRKRKLVKLTPRGMALMQDVAAVVVN